MTQQSGIQQLIDAVGPLDRKFIALDLKVNGLDTKVNELPMGSAAHKEANDMAAMRIRLLAVQEEAAQTEADVAQLKQVRISACIKGTVQFSPRSWQ
jgi:outer membrane murein-binding lipoprotein Lpp